LKKSLKESQKTYIFFNTAVRILKLTLHQYINKHSHVYIMYSVSEPITFADDTSVIISSRNFKDFCSVANLVLLHMIKWFAVNNLVLNLENEYNEIHKKKFITFYITNWLKRKIYIRGSEYKISWFTN